MGFQPPSDSAKYKEIKTEKWGKWVRNDILAERVTARSLFVCTCFPRNLTTLLETHNEIHNEAF